MNSSFVNSTSISSFADLCESSDNLPRVLVALVFTAFFLLTSLYLVGFGKRLTCSMFNVSVYRLTFLLLVADCLRVRKSSRETDSQPGYEARSLSISETSLSSTEVLLEGQVGHALVSDDWARQMRGTSVTTLWFWYGQIWCHCLLLNSILIILGQIQVISPCSRLLTPIPEVSGYWNSSWINYCNFNVTHCNFVV